jgi:DNA processing protein
VDEELACRVQLAGAPGLSRPQLRRLLQRFGSARAVLGAPAAALAAHLPRRLSESLARSSRSREGEECLARAEAAGLRALAPDSAEFPAALAVIPDPPLLLWARGELPAGPALAIVGARRASARALETARAFAAELARAGVWIVSGLAYGVDTAAHEGALAGAGRTAAVLASGLERVTPRGRQSLADRILAGGGGWLSERPPREDAHPYHFPERNRLISGLASATLVVEAREKSGSLWSARHALEQGRDVLVVPGPIDAELCRGSNRLLRDGATPILEPADLLAAVLGPLAAAAPAEAPRATANPAARAVLDFLADGPCDTDALSRALGRPSAQLAAALLELELEGAVRRDGARLSLARTR